MRSVSRAVGLLACVPAAVSCGGTGGDAARARPSVVFLSVDTLAAANLSLYGYPRRTTPGLEELAEQAVVFDACLANAPFTAPSYVSQLSGLSPRSCWIDPRASMEQGKMPERWQVWHVPGERTTLAEAFRAAGYRTAAFVDNVMCGPEFGIDQGFEVFDTSAAEVPVDDPEGGIRTIVPRALDWLDSLGESEPFFLFLNVLDVHAPYGPPPEFAGRFTDDGLGDPEHELPVARGRIDVFGAISGAAARSLAAPPLPERMKTAPLVARYDEDVLALDADVARFVGELERRGLLERTVLVVTADHGEALLASDYKFGHGVDVEAVLHVPLVIRLPERRGAGTRIRQRVELLDLYPTLVELAGLDADVAELHGRSLVPLLSGRELPARAVLHEGGLMEDSAVTEGEWRLVETTPGLSSAAAMFSHARGRRLVEERFPGSGEAALDLERLHAFLAERGDPAVLERELARELRGPFHDLYHLPSDPGQLHDLAAERPEDLARLLRLLEEGKLRSRRERERVPPDGDLAAPAVLDPDELRRLGYADGETDEH